MFVRKKTTKAGTARHYLVENRREGGKVRQKVLYYLGPFATPEEELAYWEQLARVRREQAAYQLTRAADVREKMQAELDCPSFRLGDEEMDVADDPEWEQRTRSSYGRWIAEIEAMAAELEASAVRCDDDRETLLCVLTGHDVVPAMREYHSLVGTTVRNGTAKPAAGGATGKAKKKA